MHRAIGLGPLDSINPAAVWWRHSQALRASGKSKLADAALEQALQLLLARIASLSDEGLRRNYLNKREENREIVLAWLSHARSRKLPRKQREAHLAGKVSEANPSKVGGYRIAVERIKSEADLHEFLVDEVTELSGAGRACCWKRGRTAGLRHRRLAVACGRGRAHAAGSVTPWLSEARRNRAVSLRHMPRRGEHRAAQPPDRAADRGASCWAHLLRHRRRVPRHDGDRDLLAMLASQAAAGRLTCGLPAARAQGDQRTPSSKRAGELTIINSIQQGSPGRWFPGHRRPGRRQAVHAG
jgi:hypothetical protein